MQAENPTQKILKAQKYNIKNFKHFAIIEGFTNNLFEIVKIGRVLKKYRKTLKISEYRKTEHWDKKWGIKDQ